MPTSVIFVLLCLDQLWEAGWTPLVSGPGEHHGLVLTVCPQQWGPSLSSSVEAPDSLVLRGEADTPFSSLPSLHLVEGGTSSFLQRNPFYKYLPTQSFFGFWD